MNVQFVAIEGYTISPVKVAAMALAPLLFFIKVPYVSKALLLGIIYWLTIFLSSLFHPESFRFSTLGYTGMFVFTFILFYNLIHSGVFSLDFFIKLIKTLILAYVVCLILQQISIIIGIRYLPFINLNNQFFLSLTKLPSLSIEPSHTARILGVFFYAYLKSNEIKNGYAIPIKQLFSKEHKFVIWGFLWTMTTMGSGTAFVVLGILSLYFIRKEYLVYIVPLFMILYIALPYLGFTELERAIHTAQATATLDEKMVEEADGSASARITPMLNTINNIDLTKTETWFGSGIDHGNANKENKMIGGISDYGFLSYILGLILVFSCSIRFFSLGTIMYFLGVGGGVGNIAYAWGLLYIFVCLRYFYNNRIK